MTTSTVLIGVDDLVRARADGRPVRVLDVRWSLTEPDGRPAYRAGHIPGAVFVDLGTELCRHPRARRGRHPLPTGRPAGGRPALGDHDGDRGRRLRRRRGTSPRPAPGGSCAAPAWPTSASSTAGSAAWRAAGFALATGATDGRAGDSSRTGRDADVLDADEASRLAGARAAAGRPRRRALPRRAWSRSTRAPGTSRARSAHRPPRTCARTGVSSTAAERLRERVRRLGLDPSGPVGVYCGSGVTAAHQVAALAVAGYRRRRSTRGPGRSGRRIPSCPSRRADAATRQTPLPPPPPRTSQEPA